MSSRDAGKFQLFFWGGGEDGSAYYSRNAAVSFWPVLDPVKDMLASKIGK